MEKWEKELAEIRAIMNENAKSLTRLEKLQEENAKGFAELREQQKENSNGLAQLKKSQEEMQKVLSGIGISNGLVAEDLIFNSLNNRMSFGGVTFDDINQGIRRGKRLPDGSKVIGEYDVVLFNGAAIAIIDVKYRVRKEDIDYLIDVQMPKFKVLFPQYKDFNVYLGLGGMSFQRGVERDALQRGIGTFKLKGETVEINDKHLKVWGSDSQ
jgi:hypothetical protein